MEFKALGLTKFTTKAACSAGFLNKIGLFYHRCLNSVKRFPEKMAFLVT